MPSFFKTSHLTAEELLRVAQAFVDRGENMPLSMQEDLLKCLAEALDAVQEDSRKRLDDVFVATMLT